MKLDKAIEIKETEQLFHPRVHDEDKWDANQVSIEALKLVSKCRADTCACADFPLPGETED